MIRRALPGDGQGRLALPGGYQMLGQTWQEAGGREVLEETGVAIEAASLQVVAVETTPDRRQNLLFCQGPPVTHEGHSAMTRRSRRCWSFTNLSRRPFRRIPNGCGRSSAIDDDRHR
jgi:ADP-ribose pyrophosphatase YjhB (NUDIX family)